MNGDYEKAVEYILQIPRFAKKNTPEATRRFYEYLGCPGERARIIHVAGTNGKGSVCSYINAVLIRAGIRTALFTSPHLVDIRERLKVDGEKIGKQEFVDTLNQCLEELERFRYTEGNSGYHPTFFEMMFFMGMLWFEKKEVSAVVLETGLGGRLDATNVISSPAVCVITSIGLDHMEYLGNTRAEIAGEKAGIIKKGVPVVFWEQEAEVTERIVEKAEQMGAQTVCVSEKDVLFFKFHNKTVDFSLRSEYYGYVRVCLHTPAAYQKENAALAVRALELLGRFYGPALTREIIEEGLASARWEGRMEEVMPGVVIDGAHNEDGVKAFLESVRMDGCHGRRFLLFSVVSDKRAGQMAAQILESGLFSRIAVAENESSRSCTGGQILSLFKGQAVLYKSPEEAFRLLTEEKGVADRVYAAGSLYLAGQLLKWLGRNV